MYRVFIRIAATLEDETFNVVRALWRYDGMWLSSFHKGKPMDKNRLFLQALGKFLLGVVVIGLLLFLPAGSLQYWQGWLLMGILFVPMFCAGVVMMAKNPELLRKRLNAKEEEKEQRTVVKLSGLLFVSAFVVAGLNWRFGWCVLPDWAVWVSAGLFLVCYLLYAEVLRENTYLSRTIEVQENQKVIDTASDVHGHDRPVPGHAAGAGLSPLFPDHVAVHSADRQADQE